ncbi:MAG: uroporphyrinogen decarboxylase [Eubacteriaceae bacterium]|nr:uroporphyrinogen decarboxylase [Eubacteriaceae bacterium]
MSDIEKLREERAQNLSDVYNNRIPKRVPCSVSMGLSAVAEFAGVDPKEAFWNYGLLEEAADKLCAMIPSDGCVAGGSVLSPAKYQALGSRAIVMGADGFMQHPNTHMMEEDEYDLFIEDPYAFMVEVGAPRTNKNLDYKNNPVRALMAINQANQISAAVMGNTAKVSAKMAAKYGYPAGARVRGGGGYAPLDILSDQLRSFSGMSTDIRRRPDKVEAAVEAMFPWEYEHCKCQDIEHYSRNAVANYPLHMATFMRPKDFERLWWKPWLSMINSYAAMGVRSGAFLEDNWDRFIDYLQDVPTGTQFTFEYTDAKTLKEKLGKHCVLGGGFPLKYFSQCTKDEAIDKAKEWLDIMAPGGQYYFGLDKSALVLADVNLENMKAVVETVLKYGVYDNPGEETGEIFHKEDYTELKVDEFKSRDFLTWEQYKELNPNTPEIAKKTVMDQEIAIRSFYYGLMQ